MIEAAARIGEAADLAELGRTAVETFASLVGADLASYNEIGGGRTPTVTAIGRLPTPDEAELMGALIHQNPILAHFAATGDGQALRISDFIGERELRRLPLHRELYRGIGVNFQVAISTPTVDGRVIGVALSRGRRDFDEREVAVLELLRPHLVTARRRLTEIAWLRQMSAALAGGDDAPAVLSVDSDGRIWRNTPAARALLGEEKPLLPPSLRAALELPPPGPLGPRVLAVEHRGVTLRARILPGEDAGSRLVLLALPAAQTVRLAGLGRGLSPREAEIIACLAGGEKPPDLAPRLDISPRTVEKHLGNAYRKLGVGGRSEAIRSLLENDASAPT